MGRTLVATIVIMVGAAACSSDAAPNDAEPVAGEASVVEKGLGFGSDPQLDDGSGLMTWPLSSDMDGARAAGPIRIEDHCVYLDDVEESEATFVLVLPYARSSLSDDGRGLIVDGVEFSDGSAIVVGGSSHWRDNPVWPECEPEMRWIVGSIYAP